MTDTTDNGANSGGAANGAAQSGATHATGTQDADQATAQVGVVAQYLKDLSFENPSAPQSFQEMSGGRPDINVNVNLNARRVGEEGYEVMLNITAKATVPDKNITAFVVEISYAGLFGVRNLPEQNLEPFLLIECPRFLFPFARRVVADATRDGGFPPLLLEPIDFTALYQKHKQDQAQQQGAAQGGGDQPGAAN